jgi:hypothetical protein
MQLRYTRKLYMLIVLLQHHNPSVLPSAIHLPLHKGGFGAHILRRLNTLQWAQTLFYTVQRTCQETKKGLDVHLKKL